MSSLLKVTNFLNSQFKQLQGTDIVCSVISEVTWWYIKWFNDLNLAKLLGLRGDWNPRCVPYISTGLMAVFHVYIMCVYVCVCVCVW